MPFSGKVWGTIPFGEPSIAAIRLKIRQNKFGRKDSQRLAASPRRGRNASQISGYRALGDLEAELQKFPMDLGFTPA